MAELVILLPVLGRPHRVKPVTESIRKATPDARIFFICSPGDDAMIEQVLKDPDLDYVCFEAGYAGKINTAVDLTAEPLIFLAADDLDFREGWFEAAKEKLEDGIGVVGTNDLCNASVMAGEFSTHSLVTREYTKLGTIDDPTRLLHEGYPHEYVDREFCETAKARRAYAHAHDAIVEHLHPQIGKAPWDEIYSQQRSRMRVGRRIYSRRMHLWK